MENHGAVSERVAKNVRALRGRRGLTLREVSERSAATGHRFLLSGLSKLERGDRGVTADDLHALARVFEVPMSYLTGDPDKWVQAEASEIGNRLLWTLAGIDDERMRLNEREAQAFAEARSALADDQELIAAFRDSFSDTASDSPEFVNRIMAGIERDQPTTRRKTK